MLRNTLFDACVTLRQSGEGAGRRSFADAVEMTFLCDVYRAERASYPELPPKRRFATWQVRSNTMTWLVRWRCSVA
jgi:hypothetical protein